MTVTTVFAGTNDGQIDSGGYLEDYATSARPGSGSLTASTAAQTLEFGQYATAHCMIAYVSFDTSGVPDTDTVSAAALSLLDSADNSVQDFSAQAVTYDWGATVTTADWIPGANWSALTLLATFASSGISAGAYNAFTENGANFTAAINKTGTTFIALGSDRFSAGNAPIVGETWQVKSADVAGTTSDPKLAITHAAGASGTAAKLINGGLVNRGLVNAGLVETH